jgi:hypothetical protein
MGVMVLEFVWIVFAFVSSVVGGISLSNLQKYSTTMLHWLQIDS